MKICGADGEELRCFKTGLIVRDHRYHELSRHHADAYYCPKCKSLYINRASGEDFGEHNRNQVPDVEISSPYGSIIWNRLFANKIKAAYKLELTPTNKAT